MLALTRTAAASFVLVATLSPALACFTMAPTDLRDILTADVVIEGTVTGYTLAATESDRRHRERLLLSMKERNQDRERENLEKRSLVSYALVDIRVTRRLVGSVPDQITVTWNSAFQRPKKMDVRLRTFALRYPAKGAPSLPLRSGSGVVWPVPEPDKLTVIQAPCAMPLMFDDWQLIRAVRQIFDGDGDLKAKADIFAKFFALSSR